jgi:FAD/FMN-containing dehydrogenase
VLGQLTRPSPKASSFIRQANSLSRAIALQCAPPQMMGVTATRSVPSMLLADAAIATALAALLGHDMVSMDSASRALSAQDLMTTGVIPLAIISPESPEDMATLVRFAQAQGVALFARGGGMSYSRAFQPDRARSISVDFSRLNRIRDINVADGHVTAEAGCTWAALDTALAPHGVRARWWGPMSGAVATLGGSLSQGSVTFGSGRVGASANAVKSFEIVTGSGKIIHTGSDGCADTPPFNRAFGPDLTGLFAHDAGALGIKTAVTLEIEPRPALVNGLSFAFDDFPAMVTCLSFVTQRRLASEIIAMDAEVARQNAGPPNLAQDMKAMWRIGVAAGNPLSALGRMVRIAVGGRRFLDKAKYTVHFVLEARDANELSSLFRAVRSAATGGDEIVNTVPLMTRAYPFPMLPVVHPDGRRMLPIHGIFAWSKLLAFHADYLALKASYAVQMAEQCVSVAEFFAAVAGIGLLYEPVFYWSDEHRLYHQAFRMPGDDGSSASPPANPAARALVEEMVEAIIALMRRHGSTHFQIGRLYPYASLRDDGLLQALKAELDPGNIINPGALGL